MKYFKLWLMSYLDYGLHVAHDPNPKAQMKLLSPCSPP